MSRRLSRTSAKPALVLAFYLGCGLMVIFVAGWLFAALAEDVVTGDRITAADTHIAAWLHARTSPAWTHLFLFVTFVGGPIGTTIIAIFLVLLLAWRGRWYRMLTLVLVVPGGAVLNQVLKALFSRPRPPPADALIYASGYSFPSGHAMESILLYGLLAAFATDSSLNSGVRVLVLLIATAWIGLIDFSRLYLGVHYLSDILAGTAAGITWLVFCVTAVRLFQQGSTRPYSKPYHS